MDKNEILQRAAKRAQDMGLAYAGAVSPQEAYDLLRSQPDTVLVDVRTRPELDYVGRVPGSLDIEWRRYPSMQINPDFMQQLAAKIKPDATVLFLCRSGARSHEAADAAVEAGYGHAYNVLEGFEGNRDANGHRNTVGGWRAAGLPWVQG